MTPEQEAEIRWRVSAGKRLQPSQAHGLLATVDRLRARLAAYEELGVDHDSGCPAADCLDGVVRDRCVVVLVDGETEPRRVDERRVRR